MAVGGCGQLCKCILIFFNILFAIVGFAMLGLGLWLRFSADTRGFFNIDLNTQQFVIGVVILISLGAVMLIVAVFGDYGACNENRTALGRFCGLLAFLAGVDIAAGAYAFTSRYEIGFQMAEFYSTIYLKYVNTQDPGLAVTLSLFHNGLQCCGLVGALDPLVGNTCPKMNNFIQTFTFPACPPVIVKLFEANGPVVLGFFCGTAVLLIIAMVCSSILAKEIKRSLTSPPPYLILSTSATTVAGPYPGQEPAFFYQHPSQQPLASYPYSDQEAITGIVCTAILIQQIKRSQQVVSAYYKAVY
ncbi:CD9 antigen [Aplochiton taeniatus]